MSWYEKWFDREEYDLLYRNRNDEEANWLIELVLKSTGLEPGGSILDVGCGRGRHAVNLAKRGFVVTGVDLSEKALEVATERARKENVEIRFEKGDMREAHGSDAFDLVVNLFTAFGYFEDMAEHQRTIDAFATSAKPGAWVVQDFLNADFVRSTLIKKDEQYFDDLRIEQRRRIEDGRIIKTITFFENGGSHSFEESVALLDLSDFQRMYARAGLELKHIFGDYRGGKHDAASSRLLMMSTKRT